jgi:hypothetical protein
MATKKSLQAEIDLDTRKAIRGAQDLRQANDDVRESLDDLKSPGKAAADALVAGAERIAEEEAKTEQATKSLGEALERLGAESDSSASVAELKRLGLTAEDIEADVDELAAAIKRMEDVGKSSASSVNAEFASIDTTSAEDGLRRVGAEGDKSRSVLANVVGNSAQDIGALGGVAGTAGVGLGQLAEYAAEGDIALSGAAGAAIGLTAAITIGTLAWQAYNAKSNETAKKTAEVSAEMTDLLGLLDRLRDAAGVNAEEFANVGDAFTASIVNKLDDKELVKVYRALGEIGRTGKDLGGILIDIERDSKGAMEALALGAGVPAEFARSLAEAVDFGEDWADIRQQLIKDNWSDAEIAKYKSVALALEQLNDEQQNYDVDTVAAGQLALASATDTASAALVKQAEERAKAKDADATAADVLDEFLILQADNTAKTAEAARVYGDYEKGVREAMAAQDADKVREMTTAQQNQRRAVEETAYAWGVLNGTITDEQTYLRLQQQFDDYKAGLADIDAQVKEGTITAEEGDRRKRLSLLDLQSATATYLEQVLGIPPERATEIVALINQGELDYAEGLLDILTRERTVPVKIEVKNPGKGGFYAGGGTVPGPPDGYTRITTSEYGAEEIDVPNGSRVRTASDTARAEQGPTTVNHITNVLSALSPRDVRRMQRTATRRGYR